MYTNYLYKYIAHVSLCGAKRKILQHYIKLSKFENKKISAKIDFLYQLALRSSDINEH